MEKEEILKLVEERVKKELEGHVKNDMLGYIRIFEKRKKEILKEEYGLEYETLIEKNRSTTID